MADATRIIQSDREKYTTLYHALGNVESMVKAITDLGTDFYQTYLEDEQGEPTTDISYTEFMAAFSTLQSMQAWIQTNNDQFAPMRLR